VARKSAPAEAAVAQDLADKLTGKDEITGRGLSASTVQNTLDPLRVIYRRAIRRDIVSFDPTEGLELRRPHGKRERVASPSEAAELLAALPDGERALWATAFFAGLRRGELRALRCSDLDLEQKVIRVRRGWDAVEGEQDGKSDAASRDVPILDSLSSVLASHLLASRRRDGDLVFGRSATDAFVPSTVRSRALKAWEGREPIGLQEARHTFASLLIEAGVNPKVLSTLMGHAAISITFDVYGHLMPKGLDEAAAKANRYIARLSGEGSGLTLVAS
jgi:integrase